MALRILVLSASVGAGHLRAAQAVELALRETAPPGAVIKNVDVLTLTNALFRRLYGSAYLDLVNKAPHVLGYFYDMMDKPRRADSSRDRSEQAARAARRQQVLPPLRAVLLRLRLRAPDREVRAEHLQARGPQGVHDDRPDAAAGSAPGDRGPAEPAG